ncbi:MAG: hypothetical protein MUE49_07970 [Rhodospirillales bacterium]|nr:hypothetical protein [Rhodospirillales bacterium]
MKLADAAHRVLVERINNHGAGFIGTDKENEILDPAVIKDLSFHMSAVSLLRIHIVTTAFCTHDASPFLFYSAYDVRNDAAKSTPTGATAHAKIWDWIFPQGFVTLLWLRSCTCCDLLAAISTARRRAGANSYENPSPFRRGAASVVLAGAARCESVIQNYPK